MSFLDVNSQVTPHYGMRPRDRQRSLAVFDIEGEAICVLLLNTRTIDAAYKIGNFTLEIDSTNGPGAIYNFHMQELVFFSNGAHNREFPQIMTACTHGDEEILQHIDPRELASAMNSMLPQGMRTIRMWFQQRMYMPTFRPKF